MPLQYTKEQREAIESHSDNLLILACAGSGKTEVVSRRVARIVSSGTARKSIIAFTFTERAAGELKSRLRRQLEELCPDNPSLGGMYVGTIHSFCLQLLKEIDPSYRSYEVMDEARQAALIMTQFKGWPDGGGIGLDSLRSRTRSGRYWDTIRTFLTTLNVMHQRSIQPNDLDDAALADCVNRYRKIAYGPPNYFFDFDWIIGKLIERLSADPEALEEIRARFRYLIVDEYQDIDDRQEQLIKLISDSGRRVGVTAVGDDDQAIYGWRGAQIKNILKFTDHYPEVATVNLTRNFRSTHTIVDIANSAIRLIPHHSRLPKNMTASRWNGSEFIENLAEQNDVQVRMFESGEQEEVNWVASRVLQIRGTIIRDKYGSKRAIDWADMAILLRSVRGYGSEFAGALTERGIPVVVRGTGGLFDHDEIVLVYAAFCLLSRSRLMRGVGGSKIELLDELEIREDIRQRIRNLHEQELMQSASEFEFLEWIAKKREEMDRRNLSKEHKGRLPRRIYPQDIFQEMLDVLGSAAEEGPWPHQILYNLGRLSSLITQFEAVHQWVTPANLKSLCFFLGGWAAAQADEGGVVEALAPNAVQIMTIHASKGLEWPVVFIPRVSSRNFPSSFRNRGPETFVDEHLFNPKMYASGDDGERRLWYVALTRCQKFLNITSPKRKGKKPTEYFNEIGHSYVQKFGDIENRPKGVPTPPSDVGTLPTTYSDLRYWWRCPFEYQLRSLMGFGPGVKEAYGYGQQIHNVLAELHKCAKAGTAMSTTEAMKLVEKRFHLRYTRDGLIYKPLTTLREAAKKTLQLYLEKYPENSKYILEAETPFEFVDSDSGALISGTIDLLQQLDTVTGKATPVAVVDFKTHKWKDLESFEQKKREVEDQLLLYAVAARRALGFDTQEARAHFLSPRRLNEDDHEKGLHDMFTVNVDKSRQGEMQEKVRKTVHSIRHAIKAEDFPRRGCETGHCKNCDYNSFCPGFEQWKSLETTIPHPLPREEERAEEFRLTMEDLDAGD